MARELYTIGHSNHSIEKFIDLLSMHKVDVLCDVRSAPYSKHNPQFNREPLREALKNASVQYIFLGKELGARSDDPSCYVEGKVQYHRLVRTDLFQQGISRLQKGIETYRVALMCAEKDPLMCHRTILVCRHIRSDDLDIKHILGNGKIEPNTQSEQRLLQTLRLQQDFFTSMEELIEQAYDKQGEKIAYVIHPADQSSALEEVEA
jgi:uncharacterized protein (DUF488 family)